MALRALLWLGHCRQGRYRGGVRSDQPFTAKSFVSFGDHHGVDRFYRGPDLQIDFQPDPGIAAWNRGHQRGNWNHKVAMNTRDEIGDLRGPLIR